jgi:hypothetical protein
MELNKKGLSKFKILIKLWALDHFNLPKCNNSKFKS